MNKFNFKKEALFLIIYHDIAIFHILIYRDKFKEILRFFIHE